MDDLTYHWTEHLFPLLHYRYSKAQHAPLSFFKQIYHHYQTLDYVSLIKINSFILEHNCLFLRSRFNVKVNDSVEVYQDTLSYTHTHTHIHTHTQLHTVGVEFNLSIGKKDNETGLKSVQTETFLHSD
jgi:hypothetical protein